MHRGRHTVLDRDRLSRASDVRSQDLYRGRGGRSLALSLCCRSANGDDVNVGRVGRDQRV